MKRIYKPVSIALLLEEAQRQASRAKRNVARGWESIEPLLTRLAKKPANDN